MKDRIVKLAEEFREIYRDAELSFAINNGGDKIQLTERGMKTLFPNTDFYRESFSDDYDKISTTYRDKEFMALVGKEKK